MQKRNWKIDIVNEQTGEKKSVRYNGTVDETKDFLLKLAEEDSDRYGTEGAWFFPYGMSDVREEINSDGSLYGLYTYNGLLKGDITYETALISDMS